MAPEGENASQSLCRNGCCTKEIACSLVRLFDSEI